METCARWSDLLLSAKGAFTFHPSIEGRQACWYGGARAADEAPNMLSKETRNDIDRRRFRFAEIWGEC
jgi:hypothetical protein